MAKFITVQGTTSLIVHVFAQSAIATNGVGFTGLSFSASGFTIAYIRAGQAAHSLVTLTGSGLNLGTFVSGAWLEVSSGTMPGIYEFHVPNAAVTSSGTMGRVVFMAQGNASIAPIPFEIELHPANGLFTPILANTVHSATIANVNTGTLILNVNTCTTIIGGTVDLAKTVSEVLLIATSGIAAASFRTGAIDAASLAADAANEIADATFDRVDAIETGLTLRQSHRLIASAVAGKLTGGATTTITIRNAVTDSKDRITATVDASGNRSAITYDVT